LQVAGRRGLPSRREAQAAASGRSFVTGRYPRLAAGHEVNEAWSEVEGVRPRDRERAFEQLYEASYGAVLAYTQRRVPGAADVADAVAETFTVAWRRLDEVPEGESLPWLYGVARRVLANQRRGDRRRADLSSRLHSQPVVTVEIDGQVEAEEDRRRVLSALARLKEADREILRLAGWEELSHREIAVVVGCSEAAVAVRLHRARNRLGREIGKEDRRAGQDRGAGPGRQAEGQVP
jgi:RNA polymerase sigma factor (sigma-70 family)